MPGTSAWVAELVEYKAGRPFSKEEEGKRWKGSHWRGRFHMGQTDVLPQTEYDVDLWFSWEHCDSPSWIRFRWWANTEHACFTGVLTRIRSECTLRRIYQSFRENPVTSSSHFRASAGKPTTISSHKKSNQETLSDKETISSGHQPVQGKRETFFRLSDLENAARLDFIKQKSSSHKTNLKNRKTKM